MNGYSLLMTDAGPAVGKLKDVDVKHAGQVTYDLSESYRLCSCS